MVPHENEIHETAFFPLQEGARAHKEIHGVREILRVARLQGRLSRREERLHGQGLRQGQEEDDAHLHPVHRQRNIPDRGI